MNPVVVYNIKKRREQLQKNLDDAGWDGDDAGTDDETKDVRREIDDKLHDLELSFFDIEDMIFERDEIYHTTEELYKTIAATVCFDIVKGVYCFKNRKDGDNFVISSYTAKDIRKGWGSISVSGKLLSTLIIEHASNFKETIDEWMKEYRASVDELIEKRKNWRKEMEERRASRTLERTKLKKDRERKRQLDEEPITKSKKKKL